VTATPSVPTVPSPPPGAPVNRAVLALHLFLRTASLRTALADVRTRAAAGGRERGDVPGWVLVTLMTAGLVVGLWAIAGPRFEALFTQAMDTVVGQL
jgi:hypothetical protein